MVKEKYLSPVVELLLFEEDVVTASNTYEKGDDVGEDFFE